MVLHLKKVVNNKHGIIRHSIAHTWYRWFSARLQYLHWWRHRQKQNKDQRLVQATTWCRPGDKQLHETMMTQALAQICISLTWKRIFFYFKCVLSLFFCILFSQQMPILRGMPSFKICKQLLVWWNLEKRFQLNPSYKWHLMEMSFWGSLHPLHLARKPTIHHILISTNKADSITFTNLVMYFVNPYISIRQRRMQQAYSCGFRFLGI